MKAPNLIALAAAALLTTVSVAAMNHNVTPVPAKEINGVKVTNLAPVEVRPTAEDMRSAALLADASVAAATVSPVVSRAAEASASLLGAQLAMPYYSFGNSFGRVSKE